jgi:hypothetical protein
MKNLFYFNWEEAENMKKIYSSWIGREAHTGKGKKQTLTNIVVTQSRQTGLGPEPFYHVEFIFDNTKTLSAYEFLFYNSLVGVYPGSNQNTSKTESAA